MKRDAVTSSDAARRDVCVRIYSVLKPGDVVRVQNAISKRWDRSATVISMRDSGVSYVLCDDDDVRFTRNRRYLHKISVAPVVNNDLSATRRLDRRMKEERMKVKSVKILLKFLICRRAEAPD